MEFLLKYAYHFTANQSNKNVVQSHLLMPVGYTE